MSEYTGQFLYPPRPDKAIPPGMMHLYEQRGWLAQVKKNGTNNIIAVPPDRSALLTWNRHNEPHKLWTPTAASSAAFLALPGDKWWVFVAELMHSKVADGERDTNYLHDVLVADGEYLVGTAYADRKNRLLSSFKLDGETPDAYRLKGNNNTFILKSFYGGQDGLSFKDRFKALQAEAGEGAVADEGLVLKDPGARLRYAVSEKANVHGQVKARLTHKNFSF